LSEKYRSISVKTELADLIEEFVNANRQYGYRSISQFMEDAARRRLEELKEFEPYPRMEQINCDGNGVKIHDRKLRRVADITFSRSGIRCSIDETNDCEHVKFALQQKEVQKIINQKRKDGWKLPDV